MVLPDSHKVPRVPWYSGISPPTQAFRYGTFTPYGRPSQAFPLTLVVHFTDPTTPARKRTGLGCFAFARRYLRNRYYFLLVRVLRCFSSPTALYPDYVFTRK